MCLETFDADAENDHRIGGRVILHHSVSIQVIPEKSLSGVNNKPFGISCRETCATLLFLFIFLTYLRYNFAKILSLIPESRPTPLFRNPAG